MVKQEAVVEQETNGINLSGEVDKALQSGSQDPWMGTNNEQASPGDSLILLATEVGSTGGI